MAREARHHRLRWPVSARQKLTSSSVRHILLGMIGWRHRAQVTSAHRIEQHKLRGRVREYEECYVDHHGRAGLLLPPHLQAQGDTRKQRGGR